MAGRHFFGGRLSIEVGLMGAMHTRLQEFLRGDYAEPKREKEAAQKRGFPTRLYQDERHHRDGNGGRPCRDNDG